MRTANGKCWRQFLLATGLLSLSYGASAQQTQQPGQQQTQQQGQQPQIQTESEAPGTVQVDVPIEVCISRHQSEAGPRGDENHEIDYEQLAAAVHWHGLWLDKYDDALPNRRDYAQNIETDLLPGSADTNGYERRAVFPPSDIYVDADDLISSEDGKTRLNLNWSDLPNSIITFDAALEWEFEYANLYNTKFNADTDLSASFVDADLRNASFFGAYIDATFVGARLENADFGCTKFLEGADFEQANLSRANFNDASFIDVSFEGANLDGTNFANVTFEDEVIYEPIVGALPDIAGVASAGPLENFTYLDDKTALVELRNALRQSGYRDEANALTFAIRRTERLDLAEGGVTSIIDAWFQFLFFELPVAYGNEKGRPLLIMLGGIFLFALPYYFALIRIGSDGIWRTWHPDRLRQDIGHKTPERLRLSGFEAIFTAIYFSMLSAFHIGWRDLNVGTWLSRLQTREFSYSASGWVRSLSGFQSLLSVYLLALWALSYFGQPFD